MIFHTRHVAYFSLMLALALAACGKDDKKATQVAAKVNSSELSVHQVNFVLTRSGVANPTPEQAAALRKAALERLIDQQLAVDEATEKKLDRQPDVVMALEMARREVLARAFIEQVSAAQPKPTEEEAKKYFRDNPALFAERRVFNVQEIIVPASSGVLTQVRELVGARKSMEDIANFLKGRGVQFNAGAAQRTAEQIPLEVLPRIHALKDGEATVIESQQAFTVVRVAASQPQTVTEAQALPRIIQFLANQRGSEATNKEIKRLKEKAKITYEGDFAAATAAAPAKATDAPAKPADAPKAEAAPSGSDGSSMEKGLRGLK